MINNISFFENLTTIRQYTLCLCLPMVDIMIIVKQAVHII